MTSRASQETAIAASTVATERHEADLPPLIEALAAEPDSGRRPVPPLRLPPGLHGGFVDARDARDGSLSVTLLDGRRTRAALAPHVQGALLDQCIAQGQMVLLSDGQEVPLVVGAVQTAPVPTVDRDGTLAVEAQRIRLRANQQLRLEAGANSVTIEMDGDGRLMLRSERGVFDVAANLRIYSALVELP
jgi:hypothetical protein